MKDLPRAPLAVASVSCPCLQERSAVSICNLHSLRGHLQFLRASPWSRWCNPVQRAPPDNTAAVHNPPSCRYRTHLHKRWLRLSQSFGQGSGSRGTCMESSDPPLSTHNPLHGLRTSVWWFYVFFFFLKGIFLFFGGGTWVWTQGLTFASQALYDLSHSANPFFVGYF
jgi:hypothetical protein